MPNIITRLAAAVALIAGVSAAAQADQLSDIKARGKLTCGVLGGFEPFGFQDPATREVNGYEPDLCKGLARFLGVEPDVKVVTSQGRIPELLQGRVDVEASLLGWSKEREQQVDYTNVYASVDSKLLIMKASGITSPDQLKDKKIGVAKGSLLEGIAQRRFPNATVVAFDDTPVAYLALRQGKIQALLMTETTLASLRNLDPEGDRTAILPKVYQRSQIAFVLRKGDNETLKAAINAFLDQYEKSGEGQKLYDTWFGANSKLKMTRALAVGTPLDRDEVQH